MSSRAAARGLRLLQQRGFLTPSRQAPAPTRHAVRGMANAAVAPGLPCSCEKELLELRKELMGVQKEMRGGDQRLWLLYEGLLDVNHKMIVQMASMEAESIKRQALAVESMVKTSYRILGSGGMFMFGMFTVMAPLLKSAWQCDTIDEVERRREKAAAAEGPAEGKGPEGEEATGVQDGATHGTAGSASATAEVKVKEVNQSSTDSAETTGIILAEEKAAKVAEPSGPAQVKGKGVKGAKISTPSAKNSGITLAEEKGAKVAEPSGPAQVKGKGVKGAKSSTASAENSGITLAEEKGAKVAEPSVAPQEKGPNK